MVSDKKATERIKQVYGNWAIMKENEDAMIYFNGLPGHTAKSDDKEVNIIMPESAIEKGKELQNYERVYEITGIGPQFKSYVVSNGFMEVDIDINVGDLVVCKGNVMKLFTEPSVFAITLQNLVAKVGHVGEDGKIVV